MRPARAMLCACAALAMPAGMLAAPPLYKLPQRSVSSTRQFVVYCDDVPMRIAISSFAEETKAGMLDLLQVPDKWQSPIVISIMRADPTAPGGPASQVQMYTVEGGGRKIELDVTLGDDLARANFQQQLVKSILLEMEYRGRNLPDGQPYINPPPWLVEGIAGYLRGRNSEVDADVYKALLDNNSLPAVENFLIQNPSEMNLASLKLYQAYATSLLQLLIGLPNGRECLNSYVRSVPLGNNSAIADLLNQFPALGGSTESLDKWWVISMAQLSASDRYKGLSLGETDKRLAALLKITIPMGKPGETKDFTLADYKQFKKLKQSREVLANTVTGLQGLSAQSSPMLRPVVGEYLAIATELQAGKARRVEQRLKSVATYREMILTRMDQIDDYMNWFEATQIVNRSDSFDDYMRTAKALSDQNDLSKRPDAISQYLDRIELQMQ